MQNISIKLKFQELPISCRLKAGFAVSPDTALPQSRTLYRSAFSKFANGTGVRPGRIQLLTH